MSAVKPGWTPALAGLAFSGLTAGEQNEFGEIE